MDMLHQIKIQYDLSELRWIEKGKTFKCDCGNKKVRIWNDQQLLKWHVKWRDDISKQSGFLLDRMIRSKDGAPFIVTDKGLLTLHDHIDESFASKGKEKQWGKLLSAILCHGTEYSDKDNRMATTIDFTLRNVQNSIEKQHPFLDPMTKFVLDRSLFEAKTRVKNALSLTAEVDPNKNPVLPSLSSVANAKQIFRYLFLECGDGYPIRGYRSFRQLLEEWYNLNGEESLVKLLDEIETNFSLKGDQGLLLLSECLKPYELHQAVKELSTCKAEENKTKVIETYFNSWETSRKLVQLISEWIEKGREKVVAR